MNKQVVYIRKNNQIHMDKVGVCNTEVNHGMTLDNILNTSQQNSTTVI